MPLFMDHHDDLRLSPEAVAEISSGTQSGAVDAFGVRQVELYHNAEGHVYCLLEAPSAEAVRSHHAAVGVPCGDVHEVTGVL